jgi:hypothetical protein
VGAVKSKRSLLKCFTESPAEIQVYFEHVPKLITDFPLDVCLSYVFAQLERAQNAILCCGVVKLHRADAILARTAIDVHHMTRPDFKAKFETVFAKPIPSATSDLLGEAEDARDRVMHGKQTTDKDKRNAVASVLDYAGSQPACLEHRWVQAVRGPPRLQGCGSFARRTHQSLAAQGHGFHHLVRVGAGRLTSR